MRVAASRVVVEKLRDRAQHGVLELLHYFDAESKLTNDPTGDFKSITGQDPQDAEAFVTSVKGAFE